MGTHVLVSRLEGNDHTCTVSVTIGVGRDVVAVVVAVTLAYVTMVTGTERQG